MIYPSYRKLVALLSRTPEEMTGRSHVLAQSGLAGSFTASSLLAVCALLECSILTSLVVAAVCGPLVGVGVRRAYVTLAEENGSWLHAIGWVTGAMVIAVIVTGVTLDWRYPSGGGAPHWPAPLAFAKDLGILWLLVTMIGLPWYGERSSPRASTGIMRVELRWGILAIVVGGCLLVVVEFGNLLLSPSFRLSRGFLGWSLIRDLVLFSLVSESVMWRLTWTAGESWSTPEEDEVEGGNPDDKVAVLELCAKGERQPVTAKEPSCGHFEVLRYVGEEAVVSGPVSELPSDEELWARAEQLGVDLLVACRERTAVVYAPKTGKSAAVGNSRKAIGTNAARMLLCFLALHGDDMYLIEDIACALPEISASTIRSKFSGVNKVLKAVEVARPMNRNGRWLNTLEGKTLLLVEGISSLSVLMVLTMDDIDLSHTPNQVVGSTGMPPHDRS